MFFGRGRSDVTQQSSRTARPPQDEFSSTSSNSRSRPAGESGDASPPASPNLVANGYFPVSNEDLHLLDEERGKTQQLLDVLRRAEEELERQNPQKYRMAPQIARIWPVNAKSARELESKGECPFSFVSNNLGLLHPTCRNYFRNVRDAGGDQRGMIQLTAEMTLIWFTFITMSCVGFAFEAPPSFEATLAQWLYAFSRFCWTVCAPLCVVGAGSCVLVCVFARCCAERRLVGSNGYGWGDSGVARLVSFPLALGICSFWILLLAFFSRVAASSVDVLLKSEEREEQRRNAAASAAGLVLGMVGALYGDVVCARMFFGSFRPWVLAEAKMEEERNAARKKG